MFGSDPLGTRESNDLFTSSAKKQTQSEPSPFVEDEKPVETKPAPKPATTKSGGLFSDEDTEDDLFASLRSNKTVEPKESPKPQKKKPPAGAVSLFGGVDPFGAISKKKPADDEGTTVHTS